MLDWGETDGEKWRRKRGQCQPVTKVCAFCSEVWSSGFPIKRRRNEDGHAKQAGGKKAIIGKKKNTEVDRLNSLHNSHDVRRGGCPGDTNKEPEEKGEKEHEV